MHQALTDFVELARWIARREEPRVVVLLDGVGSALANRLGPTAFLRRRRVADLRAVFPATTPVALASLATGEWPGVHGVLGLHTRVEECGVTLNALRTTDRETGRSLSAEGRSMADVVAAPPLWTGRGVVSLMPAETVNSAFAVWARGGTAARGHRTLDQAFSRAARSTADLTYVYVPDVDTLSHRLGPGHPGVLALLAELDDRLAGLERAVAGRAALVVMADHGQIEVPEATRFVLGPGDPLMAMLRWAPTGTPATPIFHVREGCDFAGAFASRFGEWFELLTPAEVVRRGLLGPGVVGDRVMSRLGDFVAIAKVPAVISPGPVVDVGWHGGLSAGEAVVPLAVA